MGAGAYLPSWGAALQLHSAGAGGEDAGGEAAVTSTPMAVDEEGAASSSTFSFGFGGEEEGVASAPPITPAPATNPSAISALPLPPPPPPRLRALLLSLSLACGTSSKRQCATLSQHIGEVLSALVAAATRAAEADAAGGGFFGGGGVRGGGGFGDALSEPFEGDSVRTMAIQALTTLATNDQIRLPNSDGAPMLLAAACVGSRLELRSPPADPSALPSAHAFGASYFLLSAMLRQRPRLVHACVLSPFECPSLTLALFHAAPLPPALRMPPDRSWWPTPTPPPPTTPPPPPPRRRRLPSSAPATFAGSSRPSRCTRRFWSATAPTFSPT